MVEDNSYLQTLDAFIEKALPRVKVGVPFNAYVREPGFRSLYVRMTQRVLHSKKYSVVLDIANVEAEQPGRGAFTKLIERLPGKGLQLVYVELVHNKRFHQKLLRMGFTEREGFGASSFYKLLE